MYMDVHVTSLTLGPQLCQICAKFLSQRSMSSDHVTRVLMRHQQVA
jgi:hypothetical protein